MGFIHHQSILSYQSHAFHIFAYTNSNGRNIGQAKSKLLFTMESSTMRSALYGIQIDLESGARVLANQSLGLLDKIAKMKRYQGEFRFPVSYWEPLKCAAWKLKCVRPSMEPAIASTMTDVLHMVKENWKGNLHVDLDDPASAMEALDMDVLIHQTRSAIKQVEQARADSITSLSENFNMFLLTTLRRLDTDRLTLLTVGNSSTVTRCIIYALTHIVDLHLHLRIIESRCGYGGGLVSLHTSLVNEIGGRASLYDRLTLQVEGDASIAILARDNHLVILGADRISPFGDVCNKPITLAAAICVKSLSPSTRIFVLSETDKIAGVTKKQEELCEQENGSETNSTVKNFGQQVSKNIHTSRNARFEWVDKRWIDGYVTETGVISNKEELLRFASNAAKREEEVFGELLEDREKTMLMFRRDSGDAMLHR